MTPNWHAGNAAIDGQPRRGWILGHFLEGSDVRASKDVEIKWGVHPAGERRENWTETEHRTTVVLLVSGRFRVNLSVESFELKETGDYIVWGPGVGHSWQAEDDSIVITVRWPSAPTTAP